VPAVQAKIATVGFAGVTSTRPMLLPTTGFPCVEFFAVSQPQKMPTLVFILL